jgi:NTP pyrophosphatase (non-canonical NTP hydrolase)
MNEARESGSFYPYDGGVINGPYKDMRSGYFDGSFYQPDSPDACQERLTNIEEAIEADRLADVHLDTYQGWVELNWKCRHGSVESFERFEAGLLGEIIELNQELGPVGLEGVFSDWKSKDKLERVDEGATSELGDVWWYGSALLTNAGISLEACVREYLHDKWQPVEWGERFTFGQLQQRVEQRTPHPFLRRSVSDLFLEDIAEERAIARDLFDSGYTMSAILSRVFNRDIVTTDPQHFLRVNNIEAVGGLFLAYGAYHASETLNSSLANVAARNIHKISRRVEAGRIDKQDGQRMVEEE